jgi:tripartite-type tricarboxylate transporter receptor subunit TctC
MHKRTLIQAGAALALAIAAPAFAQATNYPDKPIRIVVPYPPGGFNDTLARTVGAKLQAAWGQ